MASVWLGSLIAQVKGVKFYDLQASGACLGDRVLLIRRPDNPYDVNCLDVRLGRGRGRGRPLLGHLEAPIAAFLSPDARDAGGGVRVSFRVINTHIV